MKIVQDHAGHRLGHGFDLGVGEHVLVSTQFIMDKIPAGPHRTILPRRGWLARFDLSPIAMRLHGHHGGLAARGPGGDELSVGFVQTQDQPFKRLDIQRHAPGRGYVNPGHSGQEGMEPDVDGGSITVAPDGDMQLLGR